MRAKLSDSNVSAWSDKRESGGTADTSERPFLKLAEADVIAIQANPNKREGWVTLWRSLQPTMELIQTILRTKWHLADKIDVTEMLDGS